MFFHVKISTFIEFYNGLKTATKAIKNNTLNQTKSWLNTPVFKQIKNTLKKGSIAR